MSQVTLKNPEIQHRGMVLLESFDTINGKRQDAYGNPENSFQIIANLWDGYHATMMEKAGVQPIVTSFIQKHDSMIMMALMKIARIQNNPKDRDSYRDAIGYLALACDLMAHEDVEKD